MESFIKYFISYHYKTVDKEGFGNGVNTVPISIKGMDDIRKIEDAIENKLIEKLGFKVQVTILNIVKL